MIHVARPEKPRIGLFEIYGAVGVALLALARLTLATPWLRDSPLLSCPLKATTGIPCLSCGMTRAFAWFAEGRFADAALVNPLGFALAGLSVWGAFWLALSRWRPPRLALSHGGVRVRVALVALLAGNWTYLIVRSLWGGA